MINRYRYDSLNRLVRDDNAESGHTEIYEYDVCGDILSVKEYSYTTADNPQGYYHEYPYRYYDSTWPNAQSLYDHVPSYYDEEGMACDYFNNTVTWNDQRKLESVNDVIFFTYDENGMLKQRTAYGITTDYYYVGTTLISLEFDNVKMVFYYGADGRPCGFTYNGTPYYYITNLFGDIIAIYNSSGTIVTEYFYDAWGYLLDTTGSLCDSVGYDNPFRYRGYFFDEETWFYFLQTRFYDPETGRFISADSYLVAGNHINSTNMFAYCLNNPIMHVDPSGTDAESDLGPWVDQLIVMAGCVSGLLEILPYDYVYTMLDTAVNLGYDMLDIIDLSLLVFNGEEIN